MRSLSNRVLLQSDPSLVDATVLYEFSNSNPDHPDQVLSSCCLWSKKHTCAMQNCIQRIEYIEFTRDVAHAMGKAPV